MAWAIITIYISKCAQMNPQQLPKTSKFYSKCKKCDIEKTLGVGTTPLGSPKVKGIYIGASRRGHSKPVGGKPPRRHVSCFLELRAKEHGERMERSIRTLGILIPILGVGGLRPPDFGQGVVGGSG